MDPGFDIFLLLFSQTNNLLQLCCLSSMAWLCSHAPFCSRGCLNWFFCVSQNKWRAWLSVCLRQLLWLKFSAPKTAGQLSVGQMNTLPLLENQEALRSGQKRARKKYLGSRFVLFSINCGYCLAEMWRRRLMSGSQRLMPQASLPLRL